MTPTIFEKTVILSVTLSRLGTRRKVSSGAVEVEADKAMIHVSKDILESDEFKAVAKIDGEIRGYLKSRCLPSVLRSGMYLLPIPLVQEVDQKVVAPDAALRQKRDQAIEQAVAVYPAKVEEAKARLNSLFDPTDYPPVERVRAAFGMTASYLTFGVPGTLADIDRTIFEREQQKADTRIREATDEIVQVLRGALKDLVDHMVERLSPTGDGKPKIFKNTLVANLADFLASFQARNITDDRELEGLVEQARTLLSGIDPQMLRSDQAIRSYVQRGMSQIKATLDTMVVAKPTRQISFDEEDVA